MATNFSQNEILGAFSLDEMGRLSSHLESVAFKVGDLLNEGGALSSYVVFPTTAIVAVLFLLKDGTCAETAMVGREGVVGVTLLMGGGTTTSSSEVQSSGYGFRILAGHIKEEFDRGGQLMHVMLRHTQALMTQMAQTAVCNRHHPIEKQLCRWLLQCLDRMDGNDIRVTHEQISHMLGVRREGITEATLRLQALGLIGTRRCHITVLDRAGLEAHACECYQTVKSEYDRVLPQPATAGLPSMEVLRADNEGVQLRR